MIDPLNFSLPTQGVETDFPLLPEGDYPFQIAESVIEGNKDQTGFNWKMGLTLTQQVTGVDGRLCKVGTKMSDYTALQPKADAEDKDAYIRMIGQKQDAITGSTKDNRAIFDNAFVSSVIGKTVVCHVTIENYQGKNNNRLRIKAPFVG